MAVSSKKKCLGRGAVKVSVAVDVANFGALFGTKIVAVGNQDT